MIWNGWRRKIIRDAGTRFREEHSAFLTAALGSKKRYPRIPAKPVDQGGYSGLLKLERGEKRAAMWWGAAMNRMDR